MADTGLRRFLLRTVLINTQSCTYLARVRFDAASTSLALQKVRVQFTHP